MSDDQPKAPNMKSFSLNSPDAYEALCGRRERPWIPNGALPKEPRWPRGESPVWIDAETEDDAARAFGEWLGHVKKGQIG